MTTLKHYPIPPDLPACVFKQMVVVLRILQIEPMTIREVERVSKFSYGTLRHILPNLRAVGLIGVKRMVKDGRATLPLYWAGKDECLNAPHKCKPKAVAISFETVINALQEPCTAMELVEETGLGHGPILRALKWLTACRVVYPCGWDRDIAGKPVQTYRLGSHVARSKPPALTRKEINRRFRERQAQRSTYQILERLAA